LLAGPTISQAAVGDGRRASRRASIGARAAMSSGAKTWQPFGAPGGAQPVEGVGSEDLLALFVAQVCRSIGQVSGQDVETDDTQDATFDGPQDGSDVAIEAAGHIGGRWAAGGDRPQGALAAENALVVEPPAAVCSAHGEDPVDPALQYGRQAEPPERELPDHDVTGVELGKLCRDLRGETTGLCGVELLDLLLEVGPVADPGEVGRPATGSKPMA
jgi:hypothetical protein